MRRIYFLFSLVILSLPGFTQSSFYDLKVPGISGDTINMSAFSGKKILIVNIASGTDRVSQYAELKTLSQKYKDSGLVIICFPTNDFNGEPKSGEELQSFFSGTNSQFLVGKKLSVKGNEISPLYEWLTTQNKNGVIDVPMKSDFQKFLISKDGKLIGFFSGRMSPLLLDRALK